MANTHVLRVLIVDDEDSFRLRIQMALKIMENFVVRSCESGESAVEMLTNETFDVILLDKRMPDMSGIEVLEWMQKRQIQTPVIMVTAVGSEEVAVEAMQLGVYDYIRKDHLDIKRLAHAIVGAHERYLYRKQIIAREAEQELLKEKQKELDSLQMFHSTVNSLGRLVEKSLNDLGKNLARYEEEILHQIKEGNEEQCLAIFADIKHGVEVASSGVGSMRNLSSVVTHKLEEIHISPTKEDTAPAV